MDLYVGRRRSWSRFLPVILVAGAVAFFVAVQFARAPGAIGVLTLVPEVGAAGGAAPSLPWPSAGSAAVYVEGIGLIGATKESAPRPIASVTKIMTAYVILKGHPLSTGQRGPVITATSADVTTYKTLEAEDQSVVRVAAGQQLSQYEMLQGLLIASGNNVGEMLAVWDAGSVSAFVAKMNAEAASLGMKNTRYADVSGFSPASVSTAVDQVILATAAMENPVFAEIVGQAQATIPVAGVIYNINAILGQEGIIGVKTGWTEDAGGCFVFAANWRLGGRSLRVYGAVLGQDTLQKAFDTSKSLVRAVGPGVQQARLFSKGQPVAAFDPPWGRRVDVIVGEDVEMLVWPGMEVRSYFDLSTPRAPLEKDADVGSMLLVVGDQQRRVALKTAEALPGPSAAWRITRLR